MTGERGPLGTSDCERIRPGRIAQPANTVSSVGLALIGAAISARRRPAGSRLRAVVLGSAVVAAGIGSVVFHGPGGRLGHWLHDASLAAMVGFVPVDNIGALQTWAPERTLGVYGAVAATSAALLAARPAWVQELPTALGALGVATELAARRRRTAATRLRSRRGDRLWLAAAVAYLAGRSESPVCRPDSVLQPHAMWHVLAGAAMFAWAEAAMEGPAPAGPSLAGPEEGA